MVITPKLPQQQQQSPSAYWMSLKQPLRVADHQVLYEGKPSCCAACGDWFHNKKWTITSNYIEYEVGICCPVIENLQIIQIKDIHYSDGAGCCCCCGSYGVITIFSSDATDPILNIKGLPDSKRLFQQIRDAVQASQSGKVQIELRN